MKYILNILKFILAFVVLIALYMGLLELTSFIPSSKIKENVRKSADFFKEEVEQKEVIDVKYKYVTLFHFTNALMVNTAYSVDSTHPLQSFLTARKNYIPGVTQVVYKQTPKDLVSSDKYYENGFNGFAHQDLELFDTVYENDLFESYEYARYWHGYLAYLRPLLLILDYEKIMIFSAVFFGILLITCCVLVGKKIGMWPGIALFIAFLVSDLYVVTMSINEIICFDLALIFSICLLLKSDLSSVALNFFIFGSITNFLDFLTNPIVTYGIPIIVYCMLLGREKEDITIKDVISSYLKTSIAWAIAYALTWISKWVITDLILHRGIIQNAIEQMKYRTVGEHISRIKFFKRFIDVFSSYSCYIVFFMSMAVFFITLKNVKYNKEKVNKIRMLAYGIAILIPFVWYMVLLQHSYIHIFFSYRDVVVAIFAIEMLVLELTKSVYD